MSDTENQQPKRWFKKRYVALVLLALFALWMKDYVVPSTWNYKVTVEIETPDGVKSGYAVRQMRNTIPFPFFRLNMGNNVAEVVGEAVIINLSNEEVVFAVEPRDWYRPFYEAFPVRGPTTANGIRYYRSLPIGTTGEAKKNAPDLIALENIKQSSLKSKPDYQILKVEYEIVDQAVTNKILDLTGVIEAIGPYRLKKRGWR